MNLDQYIEQESSIRTNVHIHDGVLWKQTALQCCQPAYPLQVITPGSARPSRWKSIVRYSHLVPNDIESILSWRCQILAPEQLDTFNFQTLKHEKRKAINRGINNGLLVKRLSAIHEHWTDLKEVYISTAARTGYGLDSRYYDSREKEWKKKISAEFSLPGRDWHGVFFDNKLIGFLYSCLIDDTAYLMVTKFNNSFGNMRPSDYLHFQVISYYRDLAGCRRIFAGRSMRTVLTIDRFKASFGFEQIDLPAFHYYNRTLIRGARKLHSIGDVLFRHIPASRAQTFFKVHRDYGAALENLEKGE